MVVLSASAEGVDVRHWRTATAHTVRYVLVTECKADMRYATVGVCRGTCVACEWRVFSVMSVQGIDRDLGSLTWGCLCVTVERYLKVAQLVEALRYKPEGRGFDSR